MRVNEDTRPRTTTKFHSHSTQESKGREKKKRGFPPFYYVNQLSVDDTTGPQRSYDGFKVDPASVGWWTKDLQRCLPT